LGKKGNYPSDGRASGKGETESALLVVTPTRKRRMIIRKGARGKGQKPGS